MRSRQATSRLTCPARMLFTVISHFAIAHLHSHLAVVYHHDSPLPGDVTPPAQPPNSTVRGGASLVFCHRHLTPCVLFNGRHAPPWRLAPPVDLVNLIG